MIQHQKEVELSGGVSAAKQEQVEEEDDDDDDHDRVSTASPVL